MKIPIGDSELGLVILNTYCPGFTFHSIERSEFEFHKQWMYKDSGLVGQMTFKEFKTKYPYIINSRLTDRIDIIPVPAPGDELKSFYQCYRYTVEGQRHEWEQI